MFTYGHYWSLESKKVQLGQKNIKNVTSQKLPSWPVKADITGTFILLSTFSCLYRFIKYVKNIIPLSRYSHKFKKSNFPTWYKNVTPTKEPKNANFSTFGLIFQLLMLKITKACYISLKREFCLLLEI